MTPYQRLLSASGIGLLTARNRRIEPGTRGVAQIIRARDGGRAGGHCEVTGCVEIMPQVLGLGSDQIERLSRNDEMHWRLLRFHRGYDRFCCHAPHRLRVRAAAARVM